MLPTRRLLLVMLIAVIGLTAVTGPLAFARVAPEPAPGVLQPPTPTPAGYPPPYPPPVTPTPTAVPLPTATPAGPSPRVDPFIGSRVPPAVISTALANPSRVRGWGKLANPSLPYHPLYNPYRSCLTLTNPGVPYHPIFNDVVFKAGCP